MCPSWLLVAVAVVGVARGAVNQCWEHPSCQEVKSERSMMDCLQVCRSDLTVEVPVVPGDAHLQPAPPSGPEEPDLALLASYAAPPQAKRSFSAEPPLPLLSSFAAPPQAKRSYSMEHFRWGKPVGRKRRPVKVYASNGVEEESAEIFPGEMRRRQLSAASSPEDEEEKLHELDEEEQEELQGADVHEKKDGTYKMKHFRWSGPPASKRYGGFMKSWDERSQRPLLTLFKNVINKDGQQQEEEQ